jgi:hypothetical protein
VGGLGDYCTLPWTTHSSRAYPCYCIKEQSCFVPYPGETLHIRTGVPLIDCIHTCQVGFDCERFAKKEPIDSACDDDKLEHSSDADVYHKGVMRRTSLVNVLEELI